MIKSAKAIRREVKAKEDAEERARKKEEKEVRDRIASIIHTCVEEGDKDAPCYFGIPEKIQQELVDAGYCVLHFVWGYGYDGYLIDWNVSVGSRGEYEGDRFKMRGE